jgi:hypothetical protein
MNTGQKYRKRIKENKGHPKEEFRILNDFQGFKRSNDS